MMLLKKSSYYWWFDSHINPRRSPWLQSTLSEQEEKTKAIFKKWLIEEDADCFTQRAEMHDKKRAKLVKMVEDFYQANQSLAEKYDQVKSEAGTRVVLPQLGSPFSEENSAKHLKCSSDKSSVTSSDSFDSEDSEVDDPDQEETQMDLNIREQVSNTDRVESLIGNVRKLKEQNRMQTAELSVRNEEKKEVIRQLSFAISILKEENSSLRKCIKDMKKKSSSEFRKWKEIFSGRLFSLKCQPSIMAL
ncbi:protein NETWORKED 3C-like [Aristolochia californica]|uniref:protein NETWORKED 3C-like n=1 Tax=Aristolochia californica TaxID=171875 RepID=UPI0035D6C40A